MEYERLFAIYSRGRETGYASGLGRYQGVNYLQLTELYLDQYPDDEIPLQVLEIASINTFQSKTAAQEKMKKYPPCKNTKRLEVVELNYKELELITRCRKFMEERKKAQLYAERFKNKKFKCFYCGNTNISEMVVGEKTYQLMDKHKTSNVDKRFPKEITIYCNRCTTKIL